MEGVLPPSPRPTYAQGVDWSAALTALLGTIVGASVTLLADRARWRRDESQRRYEERRGSYVGFLAALHATSEALRVVPTSAGASADRRPAAWAAFGSANVNAVREQLELLAPTPVLQVGRETFRALRELRDLVADGHNIESKDYRRVLSRYQERLIRLRHVMRYDLGTPALDDEGSL